MEEDETGLEEEDSELQALESPVEEETPTTVSINSWAHEPENHEVSGENWRRGGSSHD